MANKTKTLSQIDSIRSKINRKLSNAKIEDAFNLIKKNIVLLDVSIDDVNLLKANYTNSKNQFEQGIVDKDQFDKIFIRTVRGIQSMLKIDDDAEPSVSQSIQNQKVKKFKPIYFLWFLLLLMAILVGVLYIKPVDITTQPSTNISTEKLTPEKLENHLRLLNNAETEREKKNKIIDEILYVYFKEKEMTVQIMGTNDNLVDKQQLNYFLKQSKYGNYKNTSVKSIGDSVITVKHEKLKPASQ